MNIQVDNGKWLRSGVLRWDKVMMMARLTGITLYVTGTTSSRTVRLKCNRLGIKCKFIGDLHVVGNLPGIEPTVSIEIELTKPLPASLLEGQESVFVSDAPGAFEDWQPPISEKTRKKLVASMLK